MEDEKKDQETENENPETEVNPEAPAADTVTLSKEEQQELLAKVKELEGMKENLMRKAAEYENAKKRLAKDREEFIRFNQESLIREMLGVLDNFERALDHSNEVEDAAAKGIFAGIGMVQKQLTEILKQQGLQRLEVLGKQFDPNHHEAISYLKEDGKEDEIVNEIQPGYMLHDRLLRASKVQIRASKDENK